MPQSSPSTLTLPPGRMLLAAVRPDSLDYQVSVASPVLRAAAVAAAATAPVVPDIRVGDPEGDAPTLHLNDALVPAADWTYGDGALQWSTLTAAGQTSGTILFRDDGLVGSGLITVAGAQFAVSVAVRPVVYDCVLSVNAGAHLTSAAQPQLELHTDGVDWDAATWVDAGFQFKYAVTSDIGIGNVAEIVPVFIDAATGNEWWPDGSAITAMTGDGVFSFDASGQTPDVDDRTMLPPRQQAFHPIYPTLFLAEFSPDAQTFAGAMLVNATAVPPLVYAIRGTYVPSGADGPSLIAPTPAPPTSTTTTEAIADPPWSPAMSGLPLVNLSPFEVTGTVDGQQQWGDVVQPPTIQDFYDILRAYMSDDLLKYVSPVDPTTKKPLRPALDPAVQAIAEMRGADQSDPTAWYNAMAVPYLTQALSNITEDGFSARLNSIRANNWMTEQMSAAPVYNAQMPALYARHFTALRPAIAPFLADQVAQNAMYAQHIDADAAAWQAQLVASLSNPTPDAIKVFTDMVTELTTIAKNDCFWAYWLFRYMTNPIELGRIQHASMQPGQNNTAFAREVQSGCATLSVLDPTGTFTKHYAKVVSLVQIANVLPQLLNYSGNDDAFSYVIPRLLQAFIDRYAASTDPDIQAAVRALEQAIKDGTTNDLLNGFLSIAGEITAVYDWQVLVSKFEATWPKTAKGITAVAELVTIACAAGGLAIFIIGTEGWEGLTEQGRASVVAGGIELFTNMALSLIKRGAAVVAIFTDQGLSWETALVVLNPFEDNVVAAQKLFLSGILKRILGQGSGMPGAGVYIEMDLLDSIRGAQGAASWTKTERFFGRNLDEFAIRLGAIFAIINLVLSAISLANSTDPLDIASNAFFVAAAAIEVIAFVGGWICGLAAATTIAGIAVATIVSCCTYFAAALAIIGLIIMLVLIFEHHPSPIETFATGLATDMGFYMPLGFAIESLRPYAAKDQPSRLAVMLSALGNPAAALRVDANAALSIAPFDSTTATGWLLVTDGRGFAKLTSVTSSPKSPVLSLAVGAGPTLVAAPFVDNATDLSQWWLPILVATPNTATVTAPDGTTVTVVTAGAFQFESISLPGRYLDLSGAQPVLGPTAVPIVIAMVPLAPQGLTMPNISLTTAQRDLGWVPIMASFGSSPRTWQVTPALPAFLVFDATSGMIQQVLGIAPAVMPATTFTLTCANGVSPPAATTFTVTVTPPPPPPIPPPTAAPTARAEV